MSNRMPAPTSPMVEPEISKEVKVEEKPVVQVSSGIKVVALRAGFWANQRKVAGDEFEVPSLDKVGMWMKCLDPKAHALHQKFLKDKKKPAGI